MSFQKLKILKLDNKPGILFKKIIFAKINLAAWIVLLLFFSSACQSSQKTDLRSLVPANAIVYLETQDLAKMLEAIVKSQAFRENASEIPTFSALANVQIAVAITDFETTENQISNESAVLNLTPRFVAIAETDLWQWQTRSLVENQLNVFIRKSYGNDAALEIADKNAGKLFSWSAKDGRKVYAFVKDSRIYFGNNLPAIEECLVLQSRAEQNLASLDSPSNFNRSNGLNDLAYGYISPKGIERIAALAGISAAVETSEESGAQSFIARVLPQILQNSTKEITWIARQNEVGIADEFNVVLKPEIAQITKETLQIAELNQNSAELLPAEFYSATRYNLKNPLIGWRAAIILAAKNTDKTSGNLLLQFSNKLLEPYAIADAENFLSAIDSEIVTAQFDAEGEKSLAIATIKNLENLKNSISAEINFQNSSSNQFGALIWFSEDKKTAAAIFENKFLIGESQSVLSSLEARQSGNNFAKDAKFKAFNESFGTATTFAKDVESVDAIVKVLSEKKGENSNPAIFYTTETRFTDKGIERRTVSDFGLIGTILKQLNN